MSEQQPPEPRWDRQQYEKEEKAEEEKYHEKDEKSWDEKYRRDPVSAVVWALILIWAGLVMIAANIGLLPSLTFLGAQGVSTWSVILIGAAAIVFLEVLFRLAVPSYRQPVGGSIFFACILLAIGLGNVIGWELVWPLILIGIGLSVLLRGLGRRQ